MQETASLLAHGLNPYEVFRRRDMEQKKQQSIAKMMDKSAKAREDVRKAVSEGKFRKFFIII